MSKQIKREFLSHDTLRQILAEHARYNATDGKEGQQADLSAYIIEDFDFSGLDLSEINARYSMFTRCKLVGCDLYGVYFNNSSLLAADFRNATLGKAEFYGVNASNACFDNAKLSSSIFIEANLNGATFRNADLVGATISECDLTNSVFDGADLEHSGVTNNKEDRTSWVNIKGRSIAA